MLAFLADENFVKRSMPVGQAIDELLLAAECSIEGEWEGRECAQQRRRAHWVYMSGRGARSELRQVQ